MKPLRNRHTGVMNFYKAKVIEHGGKFINIRGTLYVERTLERKRKHPITGDIENYTVMQRIKAVMPRSLK